MKAKRCVLITGGAFGNQGAHLMLAAAAQKVREELEAIPVVEIRQGTERMKRYIGVDTLLAVGRRGLHIPRLSTSRSQLLGRLPFVLSSDIAAVLDVSGFMYSDEWVGAPLSQFSRAMQYWTRRVPTYYLPQAFGPFDRSAQHARRALSGARMVFARDPESHAHVTALLGSCSSSPRIELAPDFTPAIRWGSARDSFNGDAGVIVPNWNLTRTIGEDEYIRLLGAFAQAIHDVGDRPVLLSHEGRRDEQILQAVRSRHFPTAELVARLDGMQARKLLRRAKYLVSGRFHACVSGLSQGVPTLLHSWSHKYRWLAEDYGCGDMVISKTDPSDVDELVRMLRARQDELRSRLRERAAELERRIEAMWSLVFNDLESTW